MISFKQFLAEKHLQSLEKFANNKNVSLKMSHLGDKIWYLDNIERKSDKKGSGAIVLDKITKEADKHNKSIMLHPTNKSLYNYYSKFGFKQLPGKENEYNGMVRYPQ